MIKQATGFLCRVLGGKNVLRQFYFRVVYSLVLDQLRVWEALDMLIIVVQGRAAPILHT